MSARSDIIDQATADYLVDPSHMTVTVGAYTNRRLCDAGLPNMTVEEGKSQDAAFRAEMADRWARRTTVERKVDPCFRVGTELVYY